MALSEQEELELLQLRKQKSMADAPTPRRTPQQMSRSQIARQFTEESKKKEAEQAYNVGGAVTDIGARVGLPPAVSAGLGYGAHVGMDAISALMGGHIGKGADIAMKEGGRYLMGSALKPTWAQWKSGEAATAIDTMLEKGLNATKGGVQALKERIGALDDEVARIVQSSGAKVALSDIGKSLQGTLAEFKNQVNRGTDVQAIKNAWKEFRDTYFKTSGEMPVAQAHELKRGTYRRLGEKPYERMMNPAGTESQMSIASGLREGVLKGAPEAAAPLAEEARLMKTLNVAERRALMDINKNPLSLALLAHRPDTFAMYMADKSALFKSLIARMLYRAPELGIPTATGAAGSISLQELSK